MATRNKDAEKDPASAADGAGYTVLARRYRSRSFSEIVGQEPIARTLANAIEQQRTAHAYLFCGTRGVGKTSMARIFAKALNSGASTQAEEVASAILRGQDLDVIEIDGASNRGIDDARELIAAAGIAPARSPFKIYIIDEVHMLTTPAFNALLKIMEEPPKHVKFILCTTEPHKVPATIQSRCQRFDFRSISGARIAEHLKHVLGEERVKADEDVIMLVARLANGSMRDALSLLDRLIAASTGSITRALAEEVLGLPDEAMVAELVAAIAAGDPAAALDRAASLLEQGVSVDRGLELIAERLRTLLVARVCGAESSLLELSAEGRGAAARDAEAFDTEAMVQMIALCDAASRSTRNSSSPRTLFDAALVRLTLAARFRAIPELLRGQIPAAPATAPPGAPAASSRPPAQSPSAPAAEEKKKPALAEVKPPVTAAPAARDAPALWAQMRELAQTMRDQALVDALEPIGFDGRTLHLRARPGDRPASWLPKGEALRPLAERALGAPVTVTIEPPAAPAVDPSAVAAREELRHHPKVRRVMELFDATVTKVEPSRARLATPSEAAGNGVAPSAEDEHV